MNLREALFQSKKPVHQFHDENSLMWIQTNRVNILPKNYFLPDQFVKIVAAFKPWLFLEDFWFTDSLIRDGIHGYRHNSRVAIHALYLAVQNYDLSKDELKAIMFACLIHDCRRENDNADREHGLRAANWLNERIDILPEDIQIFADHIKFAITVHTDLYDKIVEESLYDTFGLFVDILKTADSMDRYRFPRSDWWFLEKFVKLIPTQDHLAFAFDLALQTEFLYLSCKDNRKSVMTTWSRLSKNKRSPK